MFNQFYENLSVQSQIPEDVLRYLSCVLFTFPFSFIYDRYLRSQSTTFKHIYSTTITLVLFVFIHNQLYGLLNLGFALVVNYLMMLNLPRRQLPKYTLLFTLVHLSITHILRQLQDPNLVKLDYSGPHMVWTVKLIMLSFNLYDGTQQEDKLYPYQKDKRMTQVPDPLQFLGYMCAFQNFFLGPAYECSDYLKFVNDSTVFQKDLGKTKQWLYVARCILVSVFWGVIFLYLIPNYAVHNLLGSEFLEADLKTKLFTLYLTGLCDRSRYYVAWKLAQGSAVLSNLYNTEPILGYELMSNVSILKVELGWNLKMVSESWNCATNRWLRNYFYLRLAKFQSTNSLIPMLATFTVSAIWHGFYPGYYVTFLTIGTLNFLAHKLRKLCRPKVVETESHSVKLVYDVLTVLLTGATVTYIHMPFILLQFWSTFTVFQQVYFYGHIFILLATAIVFLAGGFQKVDFNKTKLKKVE